MRRGFRVSGDIGVGSPKMPRGCEAAWRSHGMSCRRQRNLFQGSYVRLVRLGDTQVGVHGLASATGDVGAPAVTQNVHQDEAPAAFIFQVRLSENWQPIAAIPD